MGAPSKEIRQWFSNQVHSAASKLYPDSHITPEQVGNSISKPKKEYGDLSCSAALRISKAIGKKPGEIAAALANEIKKSEYVSGIKEMGGYINITLNEQEYSKLVFSEVEKGGEGYGRSGLGDGKKAMVEYPSVNPNKPWHIGHLRNALLGDSISNILGFCGYSIEREDYIDDLGLQVAESFWGYTNLGNKPDKKFDLWLGEQYVEVNKMMANEKTKSGVSELLKKMEDGDEEEGRLARELCSKCVEAQHETAYSYGIYHDVLVWESDIMRAKLLGKALDTALVKGALAKRSEGKNAGCIVMDLNRVRDFAKDFENPEEREKVIIRSDGTATYVAKDIAFHMWKLGLIKSEFRYSLFSDRNGHRLYSTGKEGKAMEFGDADIVVNIIGAAQRYPQLILKAMFSLMGYKDEAEMIVHVAYGEVGIEGGSLSGREGGWMGSEAKAFTADELLKEAVAKSLEATEKSSKISDRSKIGDIAAAIGRSAIRFEFLRISPPKPVVFSWSTALNFEGNSGPYCMYTYARANRILDKAGYRRTRIDSINMKAVGREHDFELIKLLGEAQENVEKAASEYNPSVITDYIIELTSVFSKFYESMPVINSGDAQAARMRLLDAYMQTVGNMFRLIGIDSVKSM